MTLFCNELCCFTIISFQRRERVERERREKRLKQDVVTAHSKLLDGIKMRSLKKWTLEDDDDDDVPPPAVMKEDPNAKGGDGEEDAEIDPLDAYMQVCLSCFSSFPHSSGQY